MLAKGATGINEFTYQSSFHEIYGTEVAMLKTNQVEVLSSQFTIHLSFFYFQNDQNTS